MNKKSVSDLGVAAYLLMHNFKVMGRRGKDIFFQLSEENTEKKFDQLTLDYLSSEFHRFDSCLMSLKKIGEYSFDIKNNKYVTDLGAAAYILMHKYKIIGKKGKAVYFEAETDKFDDIALDYISSEFHRFDSCIMSLKKIGEYINEQ